MNSANLIVALSRFVGLLMLISVGTFLGVPVPGISEAPERISLLPPMILSSGVLIAALTYIRERDKSTTESERHLSSVLLEQAESAFSEAANLLQGPSRDNVAWVRAARALTYGNSLDARMPSCDYLEAFRTLKDRIRNQLYMTLTSAGHTGRLRGALPPQFFYGVDTYEPDEDLDEVAKRASKPISVYSVQLDALPPDPAGTRGISPKAVVAVYEFLKFPRDYDDPLESIGVWNGGWENAHDASAGARCYIEHRLSTHVIGDKVVKTPGTRDGDPAPQR